MIIPAWDGLRSMPRFGAASGVVRHGESVRFDWIGAAATRHQAVASQAGAYLSGFHPAFRMQMAPLHKSKPPLHRVPFPQFLWNPWRTRIQIEVFYIFTGWEPIEVDLAAVLP